MRRMGRESWEDEASDEGSYVSTSASSFLASLSNSA